MPSQARVVWDPDFTKYNFGPSHPMQPVRLALTARLCEEFGIFTDGDVEVLAPDVVDDAWLQTVHEPYFIDAVKAASNDPEHTNEHLGIGTDDVPTFAGMHEVSARIVEGTRAVCEAVWTGETAHGVNFCGGLHHAMAANASGFCVYNDIAVGIQRDISAAICNRCIDDNVTCNSTRFE